MDKCIKHVGLDVHKETIAVSVAEGGGGEVRYVGEIANTREAIEKLVKQLRKGGGGTAPNWAVILRVLQWVAASGLLCVVSATSRATSTFAGGAPRGRSCSIPDSRDCV